MKYALDILSVQNNGKNNNTVVCDVTNLIIIDCIIPMTPVLFPGSDIPCLRPPGAREGSHAPGAIRKRGGKLSCVLTEISSVRTFLGMKCKMSDDREGSNTKKIT